MFSTLSCFCITKDDQIALITAAHTLLPLIQSNCQQQIQIRVQSIQKECCCETIHMEFTNKLDVVVVPLPLQQQLHIVRPVEWKNFTYTGIVDPNTLQTGQTVFFLGSRSGLCKGKIFLPKCRIQLDQTDVLSSSIITESILTSDLYTRKGDSGGALFLVNESTKVFSFIGILRGKLLDSLNHYQLSPNKNTLASMPYCDSIRIFTPASLIQSHFSISQFLF